MPAIYAVGIDLREHCTACGNTCRNSARKAREGAKKMATEPQGLLPVDAIFEVVKKAQTLAKQGAVFTMLAIGLILTVLPTLAVLTWTPNDVSSDDLTVLLVAGGAILVAAGILAVVSESDGRKNALQVVKMESARYDRFLAILQERERHWSELTTQQQDHHNRMIDDALSKVTMTRLTGGD
jgi:hypothetical protein